jgi:hypothetical protein
LKAALVTSPSSSRVTPTTVLASAAALISLALSGCSLIDSAPETSEEKSFSTTVDLTGFDDSSLFILGAYAVDGDELLGDVPAAHAAVWDRFNELFPAELHPEITVFIAIDSDRSDGTDGAIQLYSAADGGTFLALDTVASQGLDVLDRTMIHEFAHLLTLRDDQVPTDESSVASCPVYSEFEGCPFADSYLFDYYSEFWFDYTLDEIEAETEEDKVERYSPDKFVTDYAATIPSEDVAEVFAEWVLADELPSGDSIVDQKMRFFEDYPELVELRDSIREALFY